MNESPAIRDQVLRALALNRVPGYHFPGNLIEISFDRVAAEDTCLSVEPGPHCLDADGQLNLAALALTADLALAATVRANLERSTRLGTVNMSLQFTGAPRTGRMEAGASFRGFFANGAGRQGAARFVATNAAGPLAFGTATFMVLSPPKDLVLHPLPHRRRVDPPPPALAPAALTREEREILRRAEQAAGAAAHARGGPSFIERFWSFETTRLDQGASGRMQNGPHVGNRVGHVQGGILLGFAAASAAAALPHHWALAGITASYISPGEGGVLRARSRIVHHGRLTAVVRTQITGKARRLVLDVMTNHLRLADH